MEACPFSLVSFHPKSDQNALRKVLSALEENGFVHDEEHSDLHIIVGGDGSLLSVMRHYRMKGKYLLIKSGHLGFFSDYDISELDQFLEDILSKEERKEKLPLLACYFQGERDEAVSDIVLQANKTALLTLYLNDRKLTESRATGIVIGTPVSSTAFLGSLGSPSILTSQEIFQYSFIAPVKNHLFTNPIEKAILSKDDILEVEVNGPSLFSLDGITIAQEFSGSIRIRMETKEGPSLIHFRDRDNVERIQRALTGRKEE